MTKSPERNYWRNIRNVALKTLIAASILGVGFAATGIALWNRALNGEPTELSIGTVRLDISHYNVGLDEGANIQVSNLDESLAGAFQAVSDTDGRKCNFLTAPYVRLTNLDQSAGSSFNLPLGLYFQTGKDHFLSCKD